MITEEQYILIKVMEECGEIIKECSKALRFGPDDYSPNDPDKIINRQLIRNELADLDYLKDLLSYRDFFDDTKPILIENIRSKYNKFLAYSMDKGVVDNETNRSTT